MHRMHKTAFLQDVTGSQPSGSKQYNKSSAVAEMGDRFAATDMVREVVVFCPFRGCWVST